MFKDYYKILEIDFNASQKEIKSAYRRQSYKWHPDFNPGIDTNNEMRDVIEAKLVLLDYEAKTLYDIEYSKYYTKTKHRGDSYSQNKYQNNHKHDTQDENKSFTKEYDSQNEFLNKWMNNARRQASELLQETIRDIRGMSKAGAKSGFDSFEEKIPGLIISTILFALVILSVKGCVN